MMYVPSFSSPMVVGLGKPDPARSNFDFIRVSPRQEAIPEGREAAVTGISGPHGLPIVKPPYGRITAYDMAKGEIAWQVPRGDGIRQTIIDLGIPDPGPVGSRGGTGPLLTKTLLFFGEGSRASRTASQASTPRLTAYDKATGEVVAQIDLPAPPSGTPMSYMAGGKQYIAFASGGGPSSVLMAVALP